MNTWIRPVQGEEGFTSEHFKLRVDNAPKYHTAKDMKKMLEKNGVQSVKVKKSPQWDYFFVTFKV